MRIRINILLIRIGAIAGIMCMIISLTFFTGKAYESGLKADSTVIMGAVTSANYPLYSEWTLQKLRPRLMSLRLKPNWIKEDDRFWYYFRTSKGTVWYIVDPSRNEKKRLCDLEDITTAIAKWTGYSESDIKINPREVEILDDDQAARITLDDSIYEYSIPIGTVSKVETVDDPLPDLSEGLSVSPNGELMLFSRGNDLYLAEISDIENTEHRLTADGCKDVWWDGQEEDSKDSRDTRIGVKAEWSNDSKRFAIIRSDNRQVGDLWTIDELAEPRPTLSRFKCAMPGEPVPQEELWIYDIPEDSIVKVDSHKWPDQLLIDIINPTTMFWNNESSRLYFTRRSRDHLQVDLCRTDPLTGKCVVLVEERMSDMVYFKPPVILKNQKGFIWWSMRDGWGHLYYYDDNGGLIRQLTSGDFNVDAVIAVDEDAQYLYFTANGREEGRNPYYRHFYRVSMDGGNTRLLTPADAEHVIVTSPSNAYFIDARSRVNEPYSWSLLDTSGRKIMDLENADISPLREAGWKPPRIFAVKAADNITELWGVMWKPFDFNPSKKYPIIIRTYPGKQDEYIPRAFSPWADEAHLAQLGFIVVRCGNRGGTFERGFEYRKFGRGELREYPIADLKAAVEHLSEQYDFIDVSRVGIYGGSSGGYCAATALFLEPDFFKAGVAISGPHDGDIMYNIWHERYNGVKMIENDDGSISWESSWPTNIEIADRLEGHLLIIHGSMDQTAHPAHSARLADALIKAGKRFEYFVIPGANHGYDQMHQYLYMEWLKAHFFAEHLLGDFRIDVDMFAIDPKKP